MTRLDHRSIARVSLSAVAAPSTNAGESLVLVEEHRRGKSLLCR
jgi:hypothetical protein